MNARPPAFHRYTCPVTAGKGACDCKYGNYAALEGIQEEDEEMEEDEENDEKENKKVVPERNKENDGKAHSQHHVSEKKGYDDRSQRSIDKSARDFYKSSGGDRRVPVVRDSKAATGQW